MAITIYIRCLYGVFGREITIHTVIYGVYIQFWPTLAVSVLGQENGIGSLVECNAVRIMV